MLLARASATWSIVVSGVFAYAAAYAMTHPGPVSSVTDDSGTHPSGTDIAANQGAIEWPAILAVVALLAAVILIRRPGRVGYLIAGALAGALLVTAGTRPSLQQLFEQSPWLLGSIGAVGLLLAILGWILSDALPEGLPGWPVHHGGT